MKKLLSIVLSVVFVGTLTVPLASASEANQWTKVTFYEAVEIPGQVLPAGTYWFVLAGDDYNRSLVRIYSSDRSKVYATEFTVNEQHSKAANGTAMTFAERNSSQPQALLEWRFPGETVGHQFQYRQPEQRELAQDQQRTVVVAAGL